MNRLRRHLDRGEVQRLRWVVQAASFALLVYGGLWGLRLGDRLPTFACVYGDCRGGSCYLMGLQHQMAHPGSWFAATGGIELLAGLLSFLLFFVLLNKAWCGFVCPLGTLQDLLTLLRRRLGLRAGRYGAVAFGRLSRIKYVLLALLLALPLAIGNPLPGVGALSHEWTAPVCQACPGRTVLPLCEGDCSQLAVDYSSGPRLALTALGLAVTGAFLVGSFVKPRWFCLFCPMSALHFAFARLGTLQLIKDGSRCTRCGDCARVCDVGISAIAEDLTSRNLVTSDCLLCLKCVAACPEDGCLQATVLGRPVYRATAEGFHHRRGHDASQ